MINQLWLRNFKSISALEGIELKPLSIFCGANSSGKSSLIQALLMLAQTFAARYDFDAVVLNGHLARLGAFEDIRTTGRPQEPISIGFNMSVPDTVAVDNASRSIMYGCDFDSPYNTVEDDYHPTIKDAWINFGAGNEWFHFQRLPAAYAPSTSRELGSGKYLKVEGLSSQELLSLEKDYPDLQVKGCECNAFVPTVILIEYNHTKKVIASLIGSMTGKAPIKVLSEYVESPDNIIPLSFFKRLKECISMERNEIRRTFENAEDIKKVVADVARTSEVTFHDFLNHLIHANFPLTESTVDHYIKSSRLHDARGWLAYIESLEEKSRKSLVGLIDKYRSDLQEAWNKGAPPNMRQARVQIRVLNQLSSFLASYFGRSVKYLGPLRNEPQAVYASVGHSDPRNVGLKGEYTAAVLHINRDRWIKYPSPPSSEHQAETEFAIKSGVLKDACKEWLSYLGVISDYQTKDKGKLGYELNVKVEADGQWQDLTHVGVGVSQVLPIVLMSLLSESNDLLIFEQPELHLHPKVQSRLCDFFCALSRFNRQCIIETHSEYLINRLRLRIAQSRDPNFAAMASVFFVTKEGGTSVFSDVSINRFGSILEWPQGFFDQTDLEIEKILFEASRKRMMEG